MIRRAITLTAAALFIFAAIGAQAKQGGQGNNNDNDGSGGGTGDPIRQVIVEVRLIDSTRFRPTGLAISDFGIDWSVETKSISDVLDFIDIDRPATLRDENKVNLRRLPVLGGLFGKTNLGQETVASEFAGAIKVGEVSRVEDTMLLEMLPGIPRTQLRTVSTVVIVNESKSFTIGGLIREEVKGNEDKVPWLGDLPLAGEFFRIGEARQKGVNLLIMITPHVVKLDE